MEIVFATNNAHKLIEIKDAIGSLYKIISISELGISEDIPETQTTLEGNAVQKAKYIFDKYNLVCFSDDTGLEVEALNGRPGVFSARYAGTGCTFDDNIDKLLKEMQGITNRKARFRAVIALVESVCKITIFEGIINGIISENRQGSEGFGYDPVFIPEGYDKSFAEMSLFEKNKISHRGRALEKLKNYLHMNNFS
jgi:XTP/dITP diphosphohydrolase